MNNAPQQRQNRRLPFLPSSLPPFLPSVLHCFVASFLCVVVGSLTHSLDTLRWRTSSLMRACLLDIVLLLRCRCRWWSCSCDCVRGWVMMGGCWEVRMQPKEQDGMCVYESVGMCTNTSLWSFSKNGGLGRDSKPGVSKTTVAELCSTRGS